MKTKGTKFVPGQVTEWLDCGNKNATVYTNSRILAFMQNAGEKMIDDSLKQENSVIIQPCYIGKNVSIKNAIVGPNVSIGDGSSIEKSVVSNSIIQKSTKISNAVIDNSMIGSSVEYKGTARDLSMGDFSTEQ
jgi:glucose-1-phosphate thymidylyltransferase